MKDYIVRATAAQGLIRAFAASTTNLVNDAQKLHGLSHTASAALGRVMTAAIMMAVDMKGQNHTLFMTIKGGGPIGNVMAMANSNGRIKGYVDNPDIQLPSNSHGKLDVGGAVGNKGKLTIIKDLGMKEPYVGQVDLVTGEIGEDIAHYMAFSEQQPTAIALGVLVNPDGSIKAAGGFFIQPLPGITDEVITIIENNISRIPAISTMVNHGKTPEEILETVLEPLEIKINGRTYPLFSCDCNRDRLKSVLLTIGKEELETILREDEGAEIICHYCNTVYHFDKNDIIELIKKSNTKA